MITNTAISMTENIFIPLKIVKRGSHREKILSDTYSAEKSDPDAALVNGIVKAYLREKLICEQFDGDSGNHPKYLLLRDLVRKLFPFSWTEQEKMLGFEF
jgi:hypothetical protein